MWAAIGVKSKKVYMTGKSRAEVCRKLLDKYPSTKEHDRFNKKGVQVKQIYPEDMKICKKVME